MSTSGTQRTFESIGVDSKLCETLDELGWKKPTRIQIETLSHAFLGRDIIGLAETGSGKTGAFTIPIIQTLMKDPRPYFALILTPTRELALQIFDQVRLLGVPHGIRVICLVGGVDQREQTALLKASKYHIVIGTPGRLIDHLTNTKGFHLKRIRFLVLDEADRILKLDDEAVGRILDQLPKERATFLFSATMTKKVEHLNRTSLREPVLVQIGNEPSTVESLQQYFVLVPQSMKDACVLHLASKRYFGKLMIIFTPTWKDSIRIALLLRHFNVGALPLNGHMSQRKRAACLSKFRAGETTNCLLATDVASRGLDIPCVDLVINYSITNNVKDYIHRVGRTARAGRTGLAINLVTQYNVERFRTIEASLERKLSPLPGYDVKTEVKALVEPVDDALRLIQRTMKEQNQKKLNAKVSKRTWLRLGEERSDEEEEELLLGMRSTRRKRKRKNNDSAIEKV